MTQWATDAFETDPRVGQILDIFAKETATDRALLRPEATIEELGIASLDLTLAVFQLESVFDIEIPVIAARPGTEFGTVGELVGHVIAVLDKAHSVAGHAPSLPGTTAVTGGRRVAITGIGAITAIGHDLGSMWTGVTGALCGIRPIANIPTERLAVTHAAEILDFDPLAHFEARRLPMLDRTSQLALVAAREAISHAGSVLAGLEPARGGVVLGAAIGQETFDSSYKALYGENAKRLHPMTVPRIMPNAPASHISMEFGLRGPCFATASACASSSHAIGLAFQMIRSGMMDLAVTGGSDASIVVGFMKAWDALRVLSPDGCRPFSKDRGGLVIGEGAAILVLEEWDRARARGAEIHGEIVGFGMSADAGELTAPDADGAARAMQAALDDAGLSPAAVEYVNAHGTGTRLNDKTEVLALRKVFGTHLDRLPVSSTKSMHGHCLNAGGAVEAAITCLALRHGVLPPTIGFREPDPDCAVDCVPNASRAASIEVAMSNSFAFGGINAVLLMRRAA